MWWIWLLGCAPQDDGGFGIVNHVDTEDQDTSSTVDDFYGRYAGDYLMAIFACDAIICMEPNAFNHEVWIAYSDDGLDWTFPARDVPFEGSVPDIIRRDNTLYAFGGRGTIKRYHFDTDTWEEPVEYTTTAGNIRWNDKSPVIGEDGLIHLFFLASEVSGHDPADCPEDNEGPCQQYFRSAIEVEGSDGTLYELQDTPNLVLELQPGQRASDPDVFQLKDGRWGMLVTWLEGSAFFVSDTLHGEYQPVESLGDPPYIAEPFYGLGVSHYIPESGEYWTYINYPADIPGSEEVMIRIDRAVHEDFDTPLQPADFIPVIKENDGSGLPSNYWAASPGFTFNQP